MDTLSCGLELDELELDELRSITHTRAAATCDRGELSRVGAARRVMGAAWEMCSDESVNEASRVSPRFRDRLNQVTGRMQEVIGDDGRVPGEPGWAVLYDAAVVELLELEGLIGAVIAPEVAAQLSAPMREVAELWELRESEPAVWEIVYGLLGEDGADVELGVLAASARACLVVEG